MKTLALKLTNDEIKRYAPYHTFKEFTEGFEDYMTCPCNLRDLGGGVDAQAYDRGAECAMRR